MPKPSHLDEVDEARRILGMYDAVVDKSQYMEIFGISQEKLDKARKLLSSRKINKPRFIE